MKVLFIGGTGNISLAVSQLAAARGIELTLLRRGQRTADLPEGVRTVVADIGEEAAVANALDDRHFDAVVDWIAFTPDQIERDIRLFRGRTNQFIFISSASAVDSGKGLLPAVHRQHNLRIAIGQRRAHDRDRKALFAIGLHQPVLAGDLIA